MSSERRQLRQDAIQAWKNFLAAKRKLKKADKQYKIDESWLYHDVRCFGPKKGCIQDKIAKEHRPVHGGGLSFVPFLGPGVLFFIPIFCNNLSYNTLVYRAGTKKCDYFKRKAKQLPQECETCEKYKENYQYFIQSRDELNIAKEEFKTCEDKLEKAKTAMRDFRKQRRQYLLSLACSHTHN